MKNILVKEGEYITVGQPIATVSQNQRLVLRAEVSQRYYNAMQSVKSANFKTPYDNKVYSLEDLNGRLLSFGKLPTRIHSLSPYLSNLTIKAK